MKAKEKPLENSLRITRYLTTSLHNSWLEILSQKYYGQRQNYLVGRQGKNEDIVNTYIHNEDTTRDKMFTSRQSSQFFVFLFFEVFLGGGISSHCWVLILSSSHSFQVSLNSFCRLGRKQESMMRNHTITSGTDWWPTNESSDFHLPFLYLHVECSWESDHYLPHLHRLPS